jgi:hypothetical protein
MNVRCYALSTGKFLPTVRRLTLPKTSQNPYLSTRRNILEDLNFRQHYEYYLKFATVNKSIQNFHKFNSGNYKRQRERNVIFMKKLSTQIFRKLAFRSSN